jgi:hypothetical protein
MSSNSGTNITLDDFNTTITASAATAIDLNSQAGSFSAGDITNTYNSTTLVANDTNATVELNGNNMTCFGYTLPICINSYAKDLRLAYEEPTGDFQLVRSQPFYADDTNREFFRNFFTGLNVNPSFTNWKIDFSLITIGIRDSKGFACYIEFASPSDGTGLVFTPNLFNSVTPFTQYTSFTNDFDSKNFVWTDICDFRNLAGTEDSYLPLYINFYVKYDIAIRGSFSWSVGLTRTTIDAV